MSKQLSRWTADTPDGHCCNCGVGIFNEVPMSKVHLLGYPPRIDDAEGYALDLCGRCNELEGHLIQVSGTKQHPARLAHYLKMRRQG